MEKIEFILPTFNRLHELKVALGCLLAQTSSKWIANVVIDIPDKTIADDIVNEINDERIYTTHLNKRYNDWGHTPREVGKQMSKADYIIMTGDDGYYCPSLVADLTAMINAYHPDIIYWDMVHSHYNYQYFRCELRTHAIDIGAFCIKRELAQQIKLGTNFAADGDYIEDFKKKFPNHVSKRVEKVLFVHN